MPSRVVNAIEQIILSTCDIPEEPRHMNRQHHNLHYHIRWNDVPLLGWEAFSTRILANAAAKAIARHGETYAIEEYGDDCGRCQGAKAKHLPTNPMDLQCPLCHAEPGQDCRTSAATRLDVFHTARVQAAAKIGN